jgi:hypothetical protein
MMIAVHDHTFPHGWAPELQSNALSIVLPLRVVRLLRVILNSTRGRLPGFIETGEGCVYTNTPTHCCTRPRPERRRWSTFAGFRSPFATTSGSHEVTTCSEYVKRTRVTTCSVRRRQAARALPCHTPGRLLPSSPCPCPCGRVRVGYGPGGLASLSALCCPSCAVWMPRAPSLLPGGAHTRGARGWGCRTPGAPRAHMGSWAHSAY